jgi:hypothetical protein
MGIPRHDWALYHDIVSFAFASLLILHCSCTGSFSRILENGSGENLFCFALEKSSFTFCSDYLKRNEGYPLSPRMERQTKGRHRGGLGWRKRFFHG